MAAKNRETLETPRRTQAIEGAGPNQETVRQFMWAIASISVHLEELRQFWARAIGISGPQWMILMALADLDKGDGVPVNAVSKLLHVDSSFVTTQSKLLEKKGFLRRRPSTADARVVLMSLADKSYKQLATLASEEERLNRFIFEEFDSRELAAFTEKLVALKLQFQKASARVAIGI